MVDLEGTTTYQYDALGQLKQVTYPGPHTDTYTYDKVGNRKTKNALTYQYDAANQMTQAGSTLYGYDAAGNQTSRGADVFAWNHENRLTSATIGGTATTYAYNGDGLRDSRTQGGNTTRFTWSWGRPLPRLLYDGTLSYVYGLGSGPLMSVSGSSVQGYFLTDGLGSVANVTDASGNAAVSYTYDVYGAIRSQSGSSANYWGFTGEQRDAESGFTYLRERYYDPATGRFLSQDPLVGRLSAPLTQNRYIYSLNNPLNFTDPTGLSTDAVGAKSTCDHLVGAIPIGCGGGGGGGKGVAVGLGLAGAGLLVGGILVLSDNDTGAPEDANAVEGPEAPSPDADYDPFGPGIRGVLETGTRGVVGVTGHAYKGMDDDNVTADEVAGAIDYGQMKRVGENRTLHYDSATNTIVVVESGNTIVTVFRPDDGQGYFDRQPTFP